MLAEPMLLALEACREGGREGGKEGRGGEEEDEEDGLMLAGTFENRK